jgi:outer membrane protein TolC
MKRIGGLLFALCLGTAARSSEAQGATVLAQTLTVEGAVELARHRAPAILAADLNRQAAALESSAVARNRRPDLALAGRALIAPKGFYDPTFTNLGEYEAKVVLGLALADGGLRARARARSALDLASARLDAGVQSRDVGLQVADLAITLLRHREVESAQRNAVEWIDRLGLLMRGAVRAGVRSTTDSVRVALERNTAVAALEKTRFNERITEIDLMALMGVQPDSTFLLIEPVFPDRPPTVEDSIRIMASVSRQPEVTIARIAEERARLDILEARRTTAPTVDLSLDAGLAGTNLTRLVPEDLLVDDPDATFADRLRRDLGASATINVRAPLRGSAARLSTQSKAIALRAAGMRSGAETVTQQRIALEILARWRSAYRSLVAAREATVGADQNLLRVKSLYSGGAILLLDLLDARRLYQDAVERHADAVQESRSAQFRAEDRP